MLLISECRNKSNVADVDLNSHHSLLLILITLYGLYAVKIFYPNSLLKFISLH